MPLPPTYPLAQEGGMEAGRQSKVMDRGEGEGSMVKALTEKKMFRLGIDDV